MRRFQSAMQKLLKGMSAAVLRFPYTVFCLVMAAGFICYMISLRKAAPLVVEKLTFTMLVGALLGMVVQFFIERSDTPWKRRTLLYSGAILLTAGYLGILWPAPEISGDILARTFVAVFSMICLVLWLPSAKKKADFNQIALVHFKSIFTSILYSAVMAGGIAAIIFAVDRLLFRVNPDSYSYTMTVVWIVFAPVFYLSLLPVFNPKTKDQAELSMQKSQYPRFLEILVSYIAIPLFSAYTLVLVAYFLKILVTTEWPSGQLGPMVLVYSAVGLVLFVLASLPENKFSVWFRRIFPKIWIPITIMQLVSVWIRLNAYGITESRYYVALFGIFSIAAGIILSIRPVTLNRSVALLAAAFAVFSILPPVDAFSISRNSQIHRMEKILQAEGILNDGKLTPNKKASSEAKQQTTNILTYLDMHSSLQYISWLPENFDIYQDMEPVFGFQPEYPINSNEQTEFFSAYLDDQTPLDISGYDAVVMIHSNRYSDGYDDVKMPVTIDGASYNILVKRSSEFEVRVSVTNEKGKELIGTDLYQYAKEVKSMVNPKSSMPPEQMTFTAENGNYHMKIIFQNIDISYGYGEQAGADYGAYVLFRED